MRLLITLNLDNDAFTPPDTSGEVARILTALAESISAADLASESGGRLRDSNGNTCGRWVVT